VIPFGFGYPLLLAALAGLLAAHILYGIRPAAAAITQAFTVALTWRIHHTHRAPAEDGENNREGKEQSALSQRLS
jgi:hypothetical protein